MVKSYILFCLGIAIGTFAYYGLTDGFYFQLTSAMVYAFIYGVTLKINGTYTAN